MSIKSSVYPKALVLALLVSSTISMTNGQATPEGVVRISSALPTLSALYTSVSIKQYSRSSVDMATSGDTNNSGERKNSLETATILERRLQPIVPEFQEELLRLQQDLLKPGSVIADLLESFNRNKWKNVIERNHPQSLEALQSLCSILLGHFGGDAALIDALVAITKLWDGPAKKVAVQVLDAQVPKWIEENKATGEVFTLLKLDETDANPFASPVFMQWEAFVTASNLESEEAATREMFDFLLSHYQDEIVRTKILNAALKLKKDSSFTAWQLIQCQLEKWKIDGKTEGDVFTLLELDPTDVKQLLASPGFDQWINFVWRGSSSASEFSKDVIYALSRHINDEAVLVEALVARTKDPTYSDMIEGLLNAQLKMWKDAGRTLDDVFKLLKLDETDANPFASPVFMQWKGFVTLSNPESKEVATREMFDFLLSHYKDEIVLI